MSALMSDMMIFYDFQAHTNDDTTTDCNAFSFEVTCHHYRGYPHGDHQKDGIGCTTVNLTYLEEQQPSDTEWPQVDIFIRV